MSKPLFAVSDVLDRVKDVVGNATYAPAKAYRWTRDAVLELYLFSPKTRKGETGTVREWPSAFTATTDKVPLDIEFLPIVTDYVIGRAFMEESDSQDHITRATTHFELFYKRAQWAELGVAAFNDRTLGPLKPRT